MSKIKTNKYDKQPLGWKFWTYAGILAVCIITLFWYAGIYQEDMAEQKKQEAPFYFLNTTWINPDINLTIGNMIYYGDMVFIEQEPYVFSGYRYVEPDFIFVDYYDYQLNRLKDKAVFIECLDAENSSLCSENWVEINCSESDLCEV